MIQLARAHATSVSCSGRALSARIASVLTPMFDASPSTSRPPLRFNATAAVDGKNKNPESEIRLTLNKNLAPLTVNLAEKNAMRLAPPPDLGAWTAASKRGSWEGGFFFAYHFLKIIHSNTVLLLQSRRRLSSAFSAPVLRLSIARPSWPVCSLAVFRQTWSRLPPRRTCGCINSLC